ncbi:MAG: type III toxin-antitoxin system ToxN/AbiQ family toxin [Lachnospiraceae bacterium]
MVSLYEIDDDYIEYLRKFDSKVLSPKAENRKHTRKYVGILSHNKEFNYFIPLSSYKSDVYDNMYESISLKKIGDMAVLRINNMIPVINSVIHRINFNEEKDQKYKRLLQNEYRIIKNREREIRTDSRIVYHYRINKENSDKKLYKICCDFKLLEEKSKEYELNKDATK